MPRLNTYLSTENDRRVREIAQRHGVPASHLLEAVALCMTDTELKSVLARHAQMRRMERAMRGVINDQVVERMRGMTPEQICKVIESIEQIASEDPDA